MPKTKEPEMVKIAVSLNRDLLEGLAEQYRQGLLTLREVAEALGSATARPRPYWGAWVCSPLSGGGVQPDIWRPWRKSYRAISLVSPREPLEPGGDGD